MEKQERAFVALLNQVLIDHLTLDDEVVLDLEAASNMSSISEIQRSLRLELSRRHKRIRVHAANILQQEETIRLVRVLEREISLGRIAMRSDRNLRKDVGLQQTFLQLLLCFHPIYLRLALETLSDKSIFMKAENDVETLLSHLKLV